MTDKQDLMIERAKWKVGGNCKYSYTSTSHQEIMRDGPTVVVGDKNILAFGHWILSE
jgi:hypothetical protein